MELRIAGREFAWGRRTYVMGVINMTPDSFSGDGLGDDTDAAVAQGLRFVDEGADMLDVGGASTRPGFSATPAEAELARVLPVIERLADEAGVPVSVDTEHSAVAEAAIGAGASVVVDISGLRGDPEMAGLVERTGVACVLMHNQRGRPFHDVVRDITDGWRKSVRLACAAGIRRERIILDPGFGFGWTESQNLEMIRRLSELRDFGFPVLIGTSRKSTLGKAGGGLPENDRLEATAASVAVAIALGVDIVRVHDVRVMARVARIADAIMRPGHAGYLDP